MVREGCSASVSARIIGNALSNEQTVPTIFSHPAAPLALAYGLGPDGVPARLVLMGAVVSLLPDLDVFAFRLGIPYDAGLGHRGFSHSLAFAALTALAGTLFHRRLGAGRRFTFLFLFACAASHCLFDAFTNGGLGVALLWPFTDARFFFPVRMIEVSPLGFSRFLSARGLEVLASEFVWVWLPLLAAAALARLFRFARRGIARSKRGDLSA